MSAVVKSNKINAAIKPVCKLKLFYILGVGFALPIYLWRNGSHVLYLTLSPIRLFLIMLFLGTSLALIITSFFVREKFPVGYLKSIQQEDLVSCGLFSYRL